MRAVVSFICLCFMLMWGHTARADERILFYKTAIHIQQNGDLTVHETIDVQAEGQQIKRGIYRDVPMGRRTYLGGFYPSPHTIISVTKNGVPEPYRIENHDTTQRIYIGSPEVFLQSGQYRYDITFTVPKQIYSAPDSDQLTWNVIGQQWAFPIDRAEAEIIFPKPTEILNSWVATGAALSTDANATITPQPDRVLISSTKPLFSYEGITVGLAWPKGVTDPSPYRAGPAGFFAQNPGLAILLVGFFASLFLSYTLWDKNGRDALRRGIAYTPPKGISPAMAAVAIEYFEPENDFAFIAALMSLVSQGLLTITEKDKKSLFKQQTFLITPTHKTPEKPLSVEEEALLQSIPSPCEIGTYDKEWEIRRRTFREALASVTNKRFINSNFKVWLIGALPFLAALAYCTWAFYPPMSIIVFIIISLVMSMVVMAPFRGSMKGIKNIIGFIFFIPIALIGAISFLGQTSLNIPYTSLLIIFAGMLMLGIFLRLMKVPYAADRQNIEHLLGFKRYLEAVEAPVIKKMAPPQMSRELFEEFLPYAIAMGVESKWIKQYETALATATLNPSQNAAGSSHTAGPSFSSSSAISGLSSAAMISALGSSLAAASTSPSSNSGGSSGGGGGGGGGGGW